MTTWFNEEYYLHSKLAQLRANGETQYNNITEVALAIVGAGYTLQEHFETYGSEERTSPNEFFNANEYLEAKARQLNDDPDSDIVWTREDVAAEIEAAGLTIWGHFEAYGWKEGVNPSNSFDVSSYLADKLVQLQAEDPEGEWTPEKLEEVLESTGLSPVSHYFAYGEDEGIPVTDVPADERVPSDSTELTKALEAYFAAQDATAEFLVDALENDLVAEAAETRDPGTDTATADDLEKALGETESALEASIPGFTAASVNVREAMIVGALGEAQAKIDDAQTDLATAQANFNAEATAAEKNLAAQYQVKTAALNQAKDARDSARVDTEAAVAAFEAALEDGVTMDPIVFPPDWAFTDMPTLTITDADGPTILATFQPFTDGSGGGRVVATADGMGYAGVQAVVDAFNEALELGDAANDARDERAVVRDELINSDNAGDLYNQVIGAGENLDAAESDLDGLEAAIADYRDIVELNDQYDALETAEENALAAIENPVDGDPAGLGFTVLEGDVDFTAGDDVYLFDEAPAADGGSGDASLDLFGTAGQDKIYFGEGFTLVALGDADINTDSVGDVNTLEIFWKEDAGNVELWVETETFGGNATGTADLVQITLTGIGGADFTDELVSGYLSAGVAA